ncbi:MAG: hypothetical protein AAB737_00145 [Patescibacteria group bacterium]
MIKSTSIQIVSAVLVLILSVLLLNPFHFWMPGMAQMATLGCLLVAFAVLSIYLLQEHAGDEREVTHRMLAGRIAFFIGSLVLVVGIAVESMHGTPNMWLVLSLAGMILGKVVARFYSDWML